MVNLIIVEMKSDNELANSIPVYFKSVKIGKFVLEKTKQTKTTKKTDYKSYLWRVSNPLYLRRVGSTSYLLRHDNRINRIVEFIIFITLAQEILPVERCMKLVERYL